MAAEDLERTIEELNAAMQALVAAINPAAAAQLERTKADREYVADIKKLNKEAEDARKKALEKEKKDQEDRQKKIEDLTEEGVKQFVKIFTSAGTAMYKGEKGMQAFNTSVDAAAGSLVALVGIIGVATGGISLVTARIVAAVSAAVAGMAEYVKAAGEQSDKLYDAFQEMSRAGAAGADGLQGVYNDMQKFGLGIQDLAKMSELLKSNSQILASFGGTVFQGRKRFAELSQGMEPFRASLMNAGMTQDEINEGLAQYLRIQTRVGQTQNLTTAQLTDGAHKYLLEQEALTKITGMNRKDQESLREKTMSQERFAGRQAQLIAQGQGDVAKSLMDLVTMIGAEAPTLAEGFADITAGNLTSAKAVMLYQASNGKALEINEKLQAKQITSAEAFDLLTSAIGDQQKASNAAGQAMLGIYETTKGPFYETLKLLAKGQGAQAKAAQEAIKQLEGQGATGKKAADAELQRQTDMRLVQQQAMMNMQDFVRYGVDPATKAMSWFGEMVETITGMLPGAGDIRKQSEERMALEKNKRAAEEQNQLIIEAMEKQKKATSEKELAAAKEAEKNAREKRKLLEDERNELIKASKYFKDKVSTPGQMATTAGGAAVGARLNTRSWKGTGTGAGGAEPPAAGGGGAQPVAPVPLSPERSKQVVDSELNADLSKLGVSTGGAAPAAPAKAAGDAAQTTTLMMMGVTPPAGLTMATGGAAPQTSIGAGIPGVAPLKPEQAPTMSAILDLIAKGESNGSYNVMVGGATYPLTDMTVSEVMQLQKKLQSEKKGSAAGKYQIIYQTLSGLIGKTGIGLGDKFDATTQDKLAEYLVRQRGFDQYSRNPTREGKERFLNSLSKEWASLPAGPDNKSYYAGVGNNAAHITWGKALEAFADGGVLGEGKLGIAGEAGPELVAGPASVTSNNDIMGAFRAMNAELASQTSMLAEIARATKASSTANEKMLRVSMN